MTLGEKQRLFMRLMPQLVAEIHRRGYECTGGDLFRDPRAHGAIGVKMGYGHAKSGHKNKLAIDINLFKDVDGDGKLDYLTKTEYHREIGEWWEKLHPLCRWGGRFNDGNHYSLEHEGIK